MKTTFSAVIALLLVQSAFATMEPPELWVVEKFKHDFPNSKEIFWSENNTEYVVRFVKDEVVWRLFLNKKDASIIALVRYYQEQNLPAHFIKRLHSFLPGAVINDVTEINVDDKTSYHVVMEEKKHIFFIIVNHEGDFSLKHKFKKS